jgi:hypothetical protein
MVTPKRGGLLTLQQARHRFTIVPSVSTVHRWATAGLQLSNGKRVRLPCQRVGKRWFTDATRIDRFLSLLNSDNSEVKSC